MNETLAGRSHSSLSRRLGLLFAIVVIAGTALTISGLIAGTAAASTNGCATYKGFYAGNCTCFAAREFDKISPAPKLDWTGIAGDWYGNALGWARSSNYNSPQIGALVVWKNSVGGHVAIVDSLGVSLGPGGSKVTSVRIRSMNSLNRGDDGKIHGFDQITTETVSLSKLRTLYGTFQGYIYPERAADLDNDGTVNDKDKAILLANWNKRISVPLGDTNKDGKRNSYDLGDINGDHAVDIFDLSILLSRWNTRGW